MRPWLCVVVAAALAASISAWGCEKQKPAADASTQGAQAKPQRSAASESTKYRERRQEMVRKLSDLQKLDARALAAMGSVPRHEFVPETWREHAYEPHNPLPIGEDQTISAPDVVAIMTHLLDVKETDKCLEIGTGSGYQAAILSVLCKEVYTIEILPGLAKSAEERLKRLGYANVQVRCADGYKGWPEQAPFDKIIVTAAPPSIPQPLVDQLKVGGRMVAPVGEPQDCNLELVTKKADGSITKEKVLRVAFVPMVGEAQKRQPEKPAGDAEKK